MTPDSKNIGDIGIKIEEILKKYNISYSISLISTEDALYFTRFSEDIIFKSGDNGIKTEILGDLKQNHKDKIMRDSLAVLLMLRESHLRSYLSLSDLLKDFSNEVDIEDMLRLVEISDR